MANGINHAKKIVLDEAEELARQLQNGHAGDQHTQGRAIALLVKMISPLYVADFVTADECKLQHPASSAAKRINVKAGPFAFEGEFNATAFVSMLAISSVGLVIFMLGKIENWW